MDGPVRAVLFSPPSDTSSVAMSDAESMPSFDVGRGGGLVRNTVKAPWVNPGS